MKEELKKEKESKIKQKSHIALHTSQNSGITLVALIITIIVLLILAVVSIRAVQEDGIITKAKEAKSATTVAQEKEKIGLAVNGWKIQKNYPTNGDTFYSFMNEKLKDVAEEIEDNGDGSITVRMQNTGNIYTIQEDGTITGPDVIKTENLSSLEKYFLGLDGKGRSLDVIMPNEETFVSINEVPDIIGEDIEVLSGVSKSSNTVIAYIAYQGKKYKFALNEETGQIKGLYGLKKLEKPAEESKVGKYVNYNGETWIILYDDATNGLQMISAESLQYNRADFNLGHNDSLINLDSLSTNFEKSVYSYNNAITTLNTACESFVQQTDITSGKITSVRCVGSNPTNKSSENATPYESDNLSKWPIGSTPGIGNKKGKSTDNNYESDYERMVALGIHKCNIENKSYWLASRFVFENSSRVDFDIRDVGDDGLCNDDYLWRVSESYANGSNGSKLLRPVVSLKSDISFSGSGTAEAPYTF